MARTGLEKVDVKQARDSLLARSQYPSVDAVRVALGNTGSKTTIHKYLKELEQEEGGGVPKSFISDALQDLVARLAARLTEEADARVEQMAREFGDKERAYESELRSAGAAAQTLETRLQAETAGHAATRAALHAETVERHTAAQQVKDLKEQRDRDLRRHERQIEQMKTELRQQQLAARGKQDELGKLNQECSRLVLELSHTKQSLYEQLTKGRELEQKLEQLRSAQRHSGDLERQLVGKTAETELLGEQLKAADAQLEPAQARVRALELSLAQANAKIQAQEQIGEQLQAYLDKMTAGTGAKRTR